MQRILERDVQPNEVSNWLLGNVQLGASPRSVRLAEWVRDIVGPDSQAGADIRQGAWTKLTTAAEGKAVPGAQAQASGIAEFVSGKGRDLAEVLFTPAERQRMEHFAATLRTTIAPEKATNRSGTGYEVARSASPWLARGAGLLGFGAPAAIRQRAR